MKRLLDWLEKGLLGLSAVLLAVMAVVVNLQVVFRYVVRRPLTWATEMSTLLLVLAVFSAAAVALRRGSFAAVTMVLDRLPGRLRTAVEAAGSLAVFSFLIAGMVATTPLIQQARNTAAVTPTLELPMDWVYLALQVGFGLQALYALAVASQNVAHLTRPPASPSDDGERGTAR